MGDIVVCPSQAEDPHGLQKVIDLPYQSEVLGIGFARGLPVHRRRPCDTNHSPFVTSRVPWKTRKPWGLSFQSKLPGQRHPLAKLTPGSTSLQNRGLCRKRSSFAAGIAITRKSCGAGTSLPFS